MSSPTQRGGSDFPLLNGLADSAIQALPSEYQDILKPGKTPDRIQKAMTWASKLDPRVMEQHRARGHKIETFEDIHTLPVKEVDAVARHFARRYERYAALTGAITGLPGGLWAIVAAGADVQLTAVYSVRMVADIAQSYGYNTSLALEQAHLAEVLALAAGVDSLRGVGDWLTRQGLTHLLPEVLPRLLTRLSVELTEEQAAKLVGRIIPGLGALISAGIDYGFVHVAGHRAITYYHDRYLVDHGLAPANLPDQQPIARQIAPAAHAPHAHALAQPANVVEGSVASSSDTAPATSPSAAVALAQPSVTPAPSRRREHPPERFGVYLAIFAVFALFATAAACVAFGAIVVHFIHG